MKNAVDQFLWMLKPRMPKNKLIIDAKSNINQIVLNTYKVDVRIFNKNIEKPLQNIAKVQYYYL